MLSSDRLQIRPISSSEIIQHKDTLIHLLETNLLINFKNHNNLKKYATNYYDDLYRYNREGSAILFGALKKRELVGFLWAYRKETLGEQRIHLSHIIVRSNERSKGIGRELLFALEEYAKSESIEKVELFTTIDNESALNFYKTQGYSIIRVQLEKNVGEPVADI